MGTSAAHRAFVLTFPGAIAAMLRKRIMTDPDENTEPQEPATEPASPAMVDGTTIDALEGLALTQKQLEEVLDSTLDSLLSIVPEVHAKAIKAEQEAWLQFRDARATSEAFALGGSMATIGSAGAAISMTRERIELLRRDLAVAQIEIGDA